MGTDLDEKHNVQIGSQIRILRLSGHWLDELPPSERAEVMSMIGEVFDVEEIDEYGHPWITKSWGLEIEGKVSSHSVALDPDEFEVICGPRG